MEPRHVLLVSPQTKARYLGFVPIYMQITWDMKVESVDANRSKFTCVVGARPSPILPRQLPHQTVVLERAHTEEETPHFAESVRWAKRNDSETHS